MQKFCFDNIDLFYYHSTHIDIVRFYSILKYGILSSNMAKERNLPYYHRNYINASCKNDYISVSHFPRTIWHYFHIKNELYDNTANKITFVLNGSIDALEKQHYKNKYKYTNERHVLNCIEREDILGVVIREHDINKKIKDIPFYLKNSHFDDSIKKCFDSILFLKNIHGYKADTNELYSHIGRLMESKLLNLYDYTNQIEQLQIYMQNYISDAYSSVLNIEDPTLQDILALYSKDISMYVMTKYDIQPISNIENLIRTEKDKYNEEYPYREYQKISQKELSRLRQKELLSLERTKLEAEMCESDKQIFCDGYAGPLTKEGNKVKEKIIKLSEHLT